MTSRIGKVEVDWPRSVGFFGAIGGGTALGLIPVPIALFIVSVPFLKLLNQPDAPRASRIFSPVVDGASNPVGGDSEGTVHWATGQTSTGGGRARAGSPSRSRKSQGAPR